MLARPTATHRIRIAVGSRDYCPQCGLLWGLHPWDSEEQDFICRRQIPEEVF